MGLGNEKENMRVQNMNSNSGEPAMIVDVKAVTVVSAHITGNFKTPQLKTVFTDAHSTYITRYSVQCIYRLIRSHRKKNLQKTLFDC